MSIPVPGNAAFRSTQFSGMLTAPVSLLIIYCNRYSHLMGGLKNVIENAMIIESRDKIYPETLLPHIRECQQTNSNNIIGNIHVDKNILAKDLNLRNQLLLYEKILILNALDRANWVKSRTAKLLGIDRRNLGYFMRKHHIMVPLEQQSPQEV